jgi:flavin-binding protein dodecin
MKVSTCQRTTGILKGLAGTRGFPGPKGEGPQTIQVLPPHGKGFTAGPIPGAPGLLKTGQRACPLHAPNKGKIMTDSPMDSGHIYKVIELVGTSDISTDDAIKSAIAQAAKTVRHMRWCETTQIRCHLKDNKVAHFQVTLKVGFHLEE